MAKKKDLSLDDLFPLTEGRTATERAIASAFPPVEEAVFGDLGYRYSQIASDQIIPNPFQPRRRFDRQKLQELADSLRIDGMLEPILVRVSPTQPGMYELAAGERRWRAAKLADLPTCPAKILDHCPDSKMRRIALLENLQREDLAPLELAETYQALLQETDEEGQKYTIRSLAALLHKDRGHVDDHLALLRVPPDARALIEEDPDIPVRIIRELGNISDENDRAYLINEVRERNLKTADLLAILQQVRTKERANKARASKVLEQSEETEAGVPASASAQPSPALARAVLEQKLKRYHTGVAKTVSYLAKDLATMNNEQRTLVRQYAMTWITELQRLLEGDGPGGVSNS